MMFPPLSVCRHACKLLDSNICRQIHCAATAALRTP